jgi:hypothetical protein
MEDTVRAKVAGIASKAKAGVAKLFEANEHENPSQNAAISLNPTVLRAFIAKTTRCNDNVTDPRYVQAQLDTIEFVDTHTEYIEQRVPKTVQCAHRALFVASEMLKTDAPAMKKAVAEITTSTERYLGMGCRFGIEKKESSYRLVCSKDWASVPEDPEAVQAGIANIEREREEWYRRIAEGVT